MQNYVYVNECEININGVSTFLNDTELKKLFIYHKYVTIPRSKVNDFMTSFLQVLHKF